MPEERRLALQVGGTATSAEERQSIEARYSEYRQLTARAVEVFGNEREAARWLSTQNSDFEGRTPIQDFIEHGLAPALQVLGRIEHGVYF
jgi:uncharacterized protein (DUF2384 family)